MRHLLVVILLLMAGLVATVTGCRGTRVPDDARLVAADSLLASAPDSALALVEALALDSLSTDGDRAYRDLLLTQARYKCYITATSDSDINRALGYYRAHSGEQEKLTRAYIYKGAVMEELGHPDSAMLYYKHAEATAAPDDYFNLGYTKMRMGALYSDCYSIDGLEIEKYKEALECYRHTNDSIHQLICLNNLGCKYRQFSPDTAEFLLREAAELAKNMNDTMKIINNAQALMVLYYHNGRYEEARQLINRVMSMGIVDLDYKLYFTAANVYAKMGSLDSSELFINLAMERGDQNDALFKMYYWGSLSDLSLAKDDSVTSSIMDRKSQQIADSLMANNTKIEIRSIENNLDRDMLKQSQKNLSNARYVFLLGIIVFIIASFFIVRQFLRIHRYDKLILDLRQEASTQLEDFRKLQQNFNNLKISDQGLKDTVNSHICLLKEIIEECYHAPRNVLANKIRRIVLFQEKNNDFWTKLYHYIDTENNGIMAHTMRRYPQLGEKDLLMIALTCMGYSCAQIAMILDYSNATSISTIRKRLSIKMRLAGTLDDYINQFKTNTIVS